MRKRYSIRVAEYRNGILKKICNNEIRKLIDKHIKENQELNIKKFSNDFNPMELAKKIYEKNNTSEINTYNLSKELLILAIAYVSDRSAPRMLYEKFEKLDGREPKPCKNESGDVFNKDVFVFTIDQYKYKIDEDEVVDKIYKFCEENNLQYIDKKTLKSPSKPRILYLYNFQEHKYEEEKVPSNRDFYEFKEEMIKKYNNKKDSIKNENEIQSIVNGNLKMIDDINNEDVNQDEKELLLHILIDLLPIGNFICDENGRKKANCGGFNGPKLVFTTEEYKNILKNHHYSLKAVLTLFGRKDLIEKYFPNLIHWESDCGDYRRLDGRTEMEYNMCMCGARTSEDYQFDLFKKISEETNSLMRLEYNGTGKERDVILDTKERREQGYYVTNNADFKLFYNDIFTFFLEQVDSYSNTFCGTEQQSLRNNKLKHLIEKNAYLLAEETFGLTNKSAWRYAFLGDSDFEDFKRTIQKDWNNKDVCKTNNDRKMFLPYNDTFKLMELFCKVLLGEVKPNRLKDVPQKYWLSIMRETYMWLVFERDGKYWENYNNPAKMQMECGESKETFTDEEFFTALEKGYGKLPNDIITKNLLEEMYPDLEKTYINKLYNLNILAIYQADKQLDAVILNSIVKNNMYDQCQKELENYHLIGDIDNMPICNDSTEILNAACTLHHILEIMDESDARRICKIIKISPLTSAYLGINRVFIYMNHKNDFKEQNYKGDVKEQEVYYTPKKKDENKSIIETRASIYASSICKYRIVEILNERLKKNLGNTKIEFKMNVDDLEKLQSETTINTYNDQYIGLYIDDEFICKVDLSINYKREINDDPKYRCRLYNGQKIKDLKDGNSLMLKVETLQSKDPNVWNFAMADGYDLNNIEEIEAINSQGSKRIEMYAMIPPNQYCKLNDFCSILGYYGILNSPKSPIAHTKLKNQVSFSEIRSNFCNMKTEN